MIPARRPAMAPDFAAHFSASASVNSASFNSDSFNDPFSNPRASAYHQHLHPWCIVRQPPALPPLIVARFRKRSDAEAHLNILRQLTPTAHYQILFDRIQPDPD